MAVWLRVNGFKAALIVITVLGAIVIAAVTSLATRRFRKTAISSRASASSST